MVEDLEMKSTEANPDVVEGYTDGAMAGMIGFRIHEKLMTSFYAMRKLQ
jgi:hypothetical protein